jgi:hypothetical protein
MQISILKDNFVDHHFLYHLLLVPFAKIFTPLWGLKVATILIGASFLTLLFWFFQKNKFAHPWLAILLALSSAPFLFRLELGKANGVSFILLLLTIEFIVHRRYWFLTLISFLYVWFYGGWLLGLFILAIFFFSQWLHELIIKRNLIAGCKKIFNREQLKLAAAVISGNLLGIIINPYFPRNLKFYWWQIIEIGMVNYQKFLDVGREWYPADLMTIVSNTRIISILLIIIVVFTIIHFRKITALGTFFFFLTVAFFLLSMKSIRYIEYYVPIAVIFIGYGLTYLRDELKWLWQALIDQKNDLRYVTIYMLIGVLTIIGLVSSYAETAINLQSIRFDYMEKALTFLETKTPARSVVAHGSWSEWPMLFYHAPSHYYLSGLDPTFSYLYNQEINEAWHLSSSQTDISATSIYSLFHDQMQARYLIASKKMSLFYDNIKKSFYFQPVYEDDDVTIFKIL